MDFKKAYDCIDRSYLFNVLNETGVDNEILNIIKDTLTNTTSKIRFAGEFSDSFEVVKTGVRQGDGLSPLLFNCVLERVIRDWIFFFTG